MEIVINLIASLLFVWLTWGWNKVVRAAKQWLERPSAQERRESEIEQARRIATSTQRLILVVSYVMVSSLGALLFVAGVLLIWAAYIAHVVPIWLAIPAGLLLGLAIGCVFTLRLLDNIREALKREEKERLSRMN